MRFAQPLRSTARLVRNSISSRLCRADYKRWSSPQGLEEWWEDRTRVIAALIPPESRVLEFGAGRRQLERHLPTGCTYTPSDLVDRGAGTIVCDLNRRPFPDLRNVAPSVAVFGGVLEYIGDVGSIAEWLARNGIETCIVSFDSFPEGLGLKERARERLRRRYFGYMNNLTERALLETFEMSRLTCVEKRTWTTQGIYRFVKLDDAEASRGQARRCHQQSARSDNAPKSFDSISPSCPADLCIPSTPCQIDARPLGLRSVRNLGPHFVITSPRSDQWAGNRSKRPEGCLAASSGPRRPPPLRSFLRDPFRELSAGQLEG